MKKKFLRLDKTLIYCYTVCGTVFSFIQEKDMPWIYNNLTQIMYHDDWKMFIFEDQKNLLENCPFIRTEYIVLDNERLEERSFIDTIIYIIDNDCYAYLFLDWKYIIPNRITRNLAHTTLISGYDKDKKVFYLSDNYDNGRFVTLEIDMYTVQKAFKSAWTASVGNIKDNDYSSAFMYLKCITAFKYDNAVYTKFDPHIFIKHLKAFINSKSDYIFETTNSKLYGYSCYEKSVRSIFA